MSWSLFSMPGPAVGDLREIVLAQDLLVLEAERAVIGGDHLQVVVPKPVPQLGLMLLGSKGRREHVLGALEVRPGQLVLGEKEVLRAGFGECRKAAVTSFPHFVQRVLGGKVDDVDRHLRDLRHGDCAVHRLCLRAWRAGERVVDGGRLPFRKARATITSITLPFSACMQMSAPFFEVWESALKMVASSTIRTLG